jgi:hypothetical protein
MQIYSVVSNSKICIQLIYRYVRYMYTMYHFHSGSVSSRVAPKKVIYIMTEISVDFCWFRKWVIGYTASGFKSCSYAWAVSYTKLDMDINSMIFCKSLSEVMSFKFKVLFSPINHAILALVLSDICERTIIR